MEFASMALQRSSFQNGLKARASENTKGNIFGEIMSKADRSLEGENISRDEYSGFRRREVNIKNDSKGIKEKLDKLEETIEKGNREDIKEAFEDIIAFLGGQFPGFKAEELNMDELKAHLEQLFSKLEGIGGVMGEQELEGIKLGLDLAKDLIASMKKVKGSGAEELIPKFKESGVEELSAKLEELISEFKGEKSADSKLSMNSKHIDIKRVSLDGDISKNEPVISTDLSPESSNEIAFEKVFLNQNMKSQLNQNMDSVSNNEVPLEKSFLGVDSSDIIKQISAKMRLNNGETLNEIKIKLTPESLGELTIKVTLERGIVSARAIVENAYVKQAMESNISQLKESLKSQGINFDSIDVFVGEDPREDRNSRENLFGRDSGQKKKRTILGVEDMELEDIGQILEESILSSDRVDTTV